LKNNRRTRTIRNRDRKYKLCTQWEQLSGKREVVHGIKKVNKKRKRNLQNSKGADTQQQQLFYYKRIIIAKLHSVKTTCNGLGRINY
jgi:hypothetical protein